MPQFNEDSLRDLIAQNAVGAISLDTSIFDQYQCNLGSQALLGLSQFLGTTTRFVLSEVVVGEVKRHIETEATEAKTKLKSALGQIRKRWRRNVDHEAVYAMLGIDRAPTEFATAEFVAFVQASAPLVVNSDELVAHSDVLRRYFALEPPFSTKERKKNEFPDAIALLSLEAWARQNRTTMLVVSRDKDWHSFADVSEHLICVSDLTVALDYFHREARFVAERAIGLLRNDGAPEMLAEIDSAIELFLEMFDPDIEGHASLDYEVDYLDPALQRWHVEPDHVPKILNADQDSVVFSLSVVAIVHFSATFRYSAFDGIDRTSVDLGTDTKNVEQSVSIPLIVSIDREFDPEPVVRRIDFSPVKVTIDFGSLDPDWGPEE